MRAELREAFEVLAVWAVAALSFAWLIGGQQAQSLAEARGRLQAIGAATALATELDGLGRSLLPAAKAPRWVTGYLPVLESTAKKHDVRLGEITPRPAEPRGSCRVLALAFSLWGSYPSVARFVEELERGVEGGPTVRVALLELDTNEAGTNRVSGTARLEVYSR